MRKQAVLGLDFLGPSVLWLLSQDRKEELAGRAVREWDQEEGGEWIAGLGGQGNEAGWGP